MADSSSSSEATSSEHSPPTSPIAVSPPTSPIHFDAINSPSASFSPNKRRDGTHRTTVLRKRRRLMLGAEADDHEHTERVEVQSSSNERINVENVIPQTSQPVLAFDDDGSSQEYEPQPSCDSDDSSEESGQESSSTDNDSDFEGSVDLNPSSPSGSSVISSVNHGSLDSDYGNVDSDKESDHESASNIDFLYDGSTLSSDEALLKVLKLFVEERWTKTSLDKNIKMIKEMLPQPNDLPSSGRAALKKLERLTVTCKEQEYEYCKSCLQLLGENYNNCDHSEGFSKFYSFSIDDQIKHFFEHRNLASLIDSYHEEVQARKDKNIICDVVDGQEYKKVREQLPGKYDLVLLWNTDGLELSRSSHEEMWLVLASICEIGPRLRPSFIIVCGVYVGDKKPDMNVFLKPFVSSLQRGFLNGVQWAHPLSKVSYTTKFTAPALIADAPAKAICLKCKNFNSRYGCNTCEQKTKQIAVEPEENNYEENEGNDRRRKKKRKKKQRLRRFIFQDDDAPAQLRTGRRMDAQGLLAEAEGKSKKGVCGKAVISDIPMLDRAHCVCAEYMHLVLLGVVKYILSVILFKIGPWFLGDNLKDIICDINQFISNIKVPDYIKRLPRGAKDFKFWKASELRAFLMYYSPPIFKLVMSDKYFEHWLLLVSGMHILLQGTITERDLEAAEIMIKSFVRDIGVLYGESFYTYNVHTLLHMCLLVRRWGSLFATSAFTFETFNGYVSSHVHGTKHLGKELINNIKISQSVAILDNYVNTSKRQYFSSRRDSIEMLSTCSPMSDFDFNDEEISFLTSCDLINFVLHKRVRIKANIFTCRFYDSDKKRAESYVQFISDEGKSCYGQIIAFVLCNPSLYCLLKVFKVDHLNLIIHTSSRWTLKTFIPVKDSTQIILLNVEKLVQKLLKVGSYLCMPVNTLEINL